MEYFPITKLYPNGIAKEYHMGSKKELENDTKFIQLFNNMGIKISDKGDEFEDFLLEFL